MSIIPSGLQRSLPAQRCAWSALYFAGGLLIPSISIAATAAETSGSVQLSWPEAAALTLEEHPALQVYALRDQALAAASRIANQRPGYRLALDVENVGGSGATRGASAAEVTLSLASVLELGDKRGARLAAVSARESLLLAERQVQALDLLSETARRFLTVAIGQAELTLVAEESTLAQQARKAVQRRVDAGAVPRAEARRASATVAEIAIRQQGLQQRVQTDRQLLALMWDGDAAEFTAVTIDLLRPQPELDTAALLAQAAANPELQRFASEQRLREAELRLVQSRNRADLDWSIGLRRLEESDATALVAGVSLPLFAGRRNQAQAAVAALARDELAPQREARRREISALLLSHAQQYRSANLAAARLQAEVVPELRAALDETRKAYQAGRYSYLEWTAARAELLATQRAVLVAVVTAHEARLAIETLTGLPLTELPLTLERRTSILSPANSELDQ